MPCIWNGYLERICDNFWANQKNPAAALPIACFPPVQTRSASVPMQMQWLQIENLARIKDIVGIESLLDHSHVFDFMFVSRIL